MAAVAWLELIGNLLSNPESLEKVCDIIPELSHDFREIALSYPELIKETEKLNQKNMDAYNEACKLVLEMLQKAIETGEISFEEKKYLIDKMLEICEKMKDQANANKLSSKDNIRIVGEFLLLGPFGFATEAAYKRFKKNKEIADKNA